MSNKIPGGFGEQPVPQKAMPGKAKAAGDAPTAKKSPPPIAPGHELGQACPVTPPKASNPQYAGSEPGQPCPGSWADYHAEWQPDPDPPAYQHGWSAWSSWEWNQWTGWYQVPWSTEDPWGGAADQYQEDPGQPMSQVASGHSDLFEVSQPPSTDPGTGRSNQGQAGSFGSNQEQAADGTSQPDAEGETAQSEVMQESDGTAQSDAGSEDSCGQLGRPVSRLFGLVGKMKSRLLSPWAGTANWGNEVVPDRPYSPTEPASSESEVELAGPHSPSAQAYSPTEPVTSPEYDPFQDADMTGP